MSRLTGGRKEGKIMRKPNKLDNPSTEDLRKHTEEMQDAFIRDMKIACVLGGLAVIVQIITLIVKW